MKPLRPFHIALFIWLCIALLSGVCLLWQGPIHIGQVTLRWKTLSEVMGGEKKSEVSEISENSEFSDQSVESDSIAAPTTPVTPAQPLPILSADKSNSGAPLQTFFEALQSSRQRAVRVVHYGDSQIEEDRITYRLRRNLQEQYGGNGYGLIPLHQTIPTRTLEQRLYINGAVQSVSGGPQRFLVYGPRSMRREDGLYGPMGQVAELNGEDAVSMHLRPRTDKHYSENYFSRIRLLADSSITLSVGNDSLSHSGIIAVPDSTMECNINLYGQGKVYGLSLEAPTGVIVDNIPMRGSSGAVFTQIDSAQLANFYRETNTRLIILQFGGNSLPNITNENYIYGAVSQLRKQVQYLKSCAPQASILFIGPSDMATSIDGVMQTYPLLPLMDNLLRRMAEKEGIAYYSVYAAMGGSGSMIRWVEQGLAGADHIHFTRAGADKAARMLWNWMNEQWTL